MASSGTENFTVDKEGQAYLKASLVKRGVVRRHTGGRGQGEEQVVEARAYHIPFSVVHLLLQAPAYQTLSFEGCCGALYLRLLQGLPVVVDDVEVLEEGVGPREILVPLMFILQGVIVCSKVHTLVDSSLE